MATAAECQKALDELLARLTELDAEQRAAHLVDRTLSITVPDLELVYRTRIGAFGADPVAEARPDDEPAQISFTANSDVLVAIAADPGSFARAWFTGRLKVRASLGDLLRLRKLA